MPEYGPRCFLLKMEEIHLTTKSAMTTQHGLRPLFFPRFELLFVTPGRAVNPLEHCSVAVAFPVSARRFQQTKSMTHVCCVGEMWSTTQVHEITLSIERQNSISRECVDDLGFVVLALFATPGKCTLPVPHLADDWFIAINDFMHAGFDPGQIVRRDRLFRPDIVVKAAFSSGSGRKQSARKQFADRLSQNMRRVMADER
ncbi:hypothetical protein Amal_03479 [Acetobacter malorum]|uniref:Uncharacterized protein n=1 Tax=Acetobacter malorum TaxID=178901 RepID=A0A177G7U9_9PROT|nr:hypothetical protein Amal_03479 [Acetobacter malorum]